MILHVVIYKSQSGLWWYRSWATLAQLMAWWVCQHQVITWTNAKFLLVRLSGSYLGEISQGTILYNEFENCTYLNYCHISQVPMSMGLLPDTWNCGSSMLRECRERFPRHRLQRKPLVSDPGMHDGTWVTHVPWCMVGSLTRGDRENVPGILGACTTRSFTHLARGPWHANTIVPARLSANSLLTTELYLISAVN